MHVLVALAAAAVAVAAGQPCAVATGSTLVGPYCVCRVLWSCQGEACLKFRNLHVFTTGATIQREGFLHNASGARCDPGQLDSTLEAVVDLLHQNERGMAHLFPENPYQGTILRTWGKAMQPIPSLAECLARVGGQALLCEERVFGIGLSRTATTTLEYMLATAGNRTMHYPAVTLANLSEVESPYLVSGWGPQLRFLDHFEFANDLPVSFFFDELAHRYPRARFILTERFLPSWSASMAVHLHKMRDFIEALAEAKRSRAYFIDSLMYGSVDTDAHWSHQRGALRHFTQVLSAVHPERLLVVNLVNTADRRLVEREVCAFVRVPKSRCPKARVTNSKGMQGFDEIFQTLLSWRRQLLQFPDLVALLATPASP